MHSNLVRASDEVTGVTPEDRTQSLQKSIYPVAKAEHLTQVANDVANIGIYP